MHARCSMKCTSHGFSCGTLSLKACCELDEPCHGAAVHTHVVKNGLEFLTLVRTELMIMCVKFGELGSADYLFTTMVERDLVAWNAYIAACVQNGHAKKALALFHEMRDGGSKPDVVTLVSVLSACGQLGCSEIGEELYDIEKKEKACFNIIVDNARLDMHVKCGNINMAEILFEEMPKRNVITWSTMIVGYAINGDSEKALTMFSKMQDAGTKPNYVTYLGVLSACSHAGLVSEGWKFFNLMNMSGDESIKHRKEHYACMVHLLGRSGRLEEAYNLIRSMPLEPDSGVWGALLGACAVHQNVELGQDVADVIFEIAPNIASYHVLMSNMYASAGKWDSVKKVRQQMRKQGVRKITAYSSVELNGELNVFHGGDRSHPQSDLIHKKLESILRQIKTMGYEAKTVYAFHDVDVEEKEATLSTHSEKLAISFALINASPEQPIKVMKNLRTCDDCHTFFKFVSRISGREIVMRDKIRFHHFRDGVCSCKDFW